MICADESILVPENDKKQNPDVSFTNKYESYGPCSYRYKLICVDDQLCKPFK